MVEWTHENNKHVTGVVKSQEQLRSLLHNLELQGHGNSDVSVLMSPETKEGYACPEIEEASKAPEGAAVGGLSGGLLGAIIGGLTLVGSVVLPGAGLLVAGPIVGAITGGAIGTAAGGLVGALIGAGIPEHEARRFEQLLQEQGNAVVIAHVPPRQVPDVEEIFRNNGALDVHVQHA